ncbi:hypothetical protein AA102526_1857 [Asaia lannensis NBRC 102526]|nr:hypothetical protein AA102526_1857 [Asaia lannensis NBRC 102526]
MGGITGVSFSWGLSLFSGCDAERVIETNRISRVNRFDRSMHNKMAWADQYDPLVISHTHIAANPFGAMANALAA